MRRRIDLGASSSSHRDEKFDTKRLKTQAKFSTRHDNSNLFLEAIRPDNLNYGDPIESGDELKARLNNFEFGNFPGYFNYRNKAARDVEATTNNRTPTCDELISSHPTEDSKSNNTAIQASNSDDRSIDDSASSKTAGFSDERIEILKKEWFNDKTVLDIGCNRGHITYAIAQQYSPNFILGIDIDVRMINMANRDIHLHIEDNLIKRSLEARKLRAEELHTNGVDSQYREDLYHLPLSSYIAQGPIAIASSVDINSNSNQASLRPVEVSLNAAHVFPNNILFVEHNYVLAKDELVEKQKSFFDTILCLSVTKWIHLNYRDEGLKRFFKRTYNHLNPDGLLILEVQPFDNYFRRKKLSDRLKANYQRILFKPENFDEFLLSEEVGFRKIIFTTTTEHRCAGFKRPLKVFLK